MDLFDRIRLRQDQKVVVALLMAGAANEAVAAEMVFIIAQPLDLRAHGTVKNEDALAGGFLSAANTSLPSRFAPSGPKRLSNTGGLLDVVTDQIDQIT